jgi:hypothetical protein
MKRARVIATCIVTAIVGAGAVAILLHPKEPVYRGRTVNGWLGKVFDPSRQGEALQALREMGPQAVPFEIRALARSDSTLSRRYQGIYPKLPFRKYLPQPTQAQLIRTAAELALLNNPQAAEFIAEIVPLLKHQDATVRLHASSILLHLIREKDTFCIPNLIEALNDPQASVRKNMALALARFGPAARAAIPALEKGLNADLVELRIGCARALSVIDTNTAPMTKPVLKEALGDGDPMIRHWAAVYLSRIDANDEQVVPVFGGSLTNPATGIRMSAAYSLIPFGAKAKSAVPGLIRALSDPEASVREAARAALKRIDPEAAANAGVK